MDVQKRFWQEFIDLRSDAAYISYYHSKTDTIDRYLNGFSAIASSTAVAGWVLWRESVPVLGLTVDFRIVWSIIIMGSQILTAAKEYLPYKARLKSLYALSNDLDQLSIIVENDWFKVSRGLLSEAEINDLHMDIKRRKLEATRKNFPSASLPQDRRLLDRADAETQLYVRSFFGSE